MATHVTVQKLVRQFRRMGFRVRNGHRPRWAERRWDFCYVDGSLFPVNAAANEAIDQALLELGEGAQLFKDFMATRKRRT
jgi:hypothetical protein